MAHTVQIDIKEFDSMPNYANVRVGTVAALYGVSVQTVWRRLRLGLVPKPHKKGGTTVWKVGDIKTALQDDMKRAESDDSANQHPE